MRVHLPKIASVIRRVGMRLAGVGAYFESEKAEMAFLRKLMGNQQWSGKLESLTDRQVASVTARVFSGTEYGTIEDAVITEICDRLSRSSAGSNTVLDQEHPYRGARLVVRFVKGVCSGCARVGYVDAKLSCCPWCLAWRVMTEERHEKLSRTLLQKFAAGLFKRKNVGEQSR